MLTTLGDGFWNTKSLPHHGIPSLRLSDGPNGVRGGTFFAGTKGAVSSTSTYLWRVSIKALDNRYFHVGLRLVQHGIKIYSIEPDALWPKKLLLRVYMFS